MMKSIVSMIVVLAVAFLFTRPAQAGYAAGMNQYAGYHVMHGQVDPMGLFPSATGQANDPSTVYLVTGSPHGTLDDGPSADIRVPIAPIDDLFIFANDEDYGNWIEKNFDIDKHKENIESQTTSEIQSFYCGVGPGKYEMNLNYKDVLVYGQGFDYEFHIGSFVIVAKKVSIEINDDGSYSWESKLVAKNTKGLQEGDIDLPVAKQILMLLYPDRSSVPSTVGKWPLSGSGQCPDRCGTYNSGDF